MDTRQRQAGATGAWAGGLRVAVQSEVLWAIERPGLSEAPAKQAIYLWSISGLSGPQQGFGALRWAVQESGSRGRDQRSRLPSETLFAMYTKRRNTAV